MAYRPEVREAITQYLWNVAAYLTAATEAERIETLQNLESHLYDALAERSDDPTPADVAAMLAEMPPPQAYRAEGEAHPTAAPAPTTWDKISASLSIALTKVSWEAVLGAVIYLVAFGLLLRGFTAFIFLQHAAGMSQGLPGMEVPAGFHSAVNAQQTLAMVMGIFYLIAGLLCAALATYLGQVGLNRIQTAKEPVTGLRLSLTVRYGYIPLAMDLALIGLVIGTHMHNTIGSPAMLIFILGIVCLALIIVRIIRLVTKRPMGDVPPIHLLALILLTSIIALYTGVYATGIETFFFIALLVLLNIATIRWIWQREPAERPAPATPFTG